MEQNMLARLVAENMHKIYAWSLAKVYDKQDAEDLASEIVCAVLDSGSTLRNDAAFYGFMWQIAENTLCRYIRSKQNTAIPLDEAPVGVYWQDTDDKIMHNEQLAMLRRELSILSGKYREAIVQYYIHDKSCSEIAESLQISVEMVKYYLFQSRKLLKECINMTREFGEKSYAPGVFVADFWGGKNSYYHLFDRKLPGNIMLAAFNKPITLSELSVELGVSTPYLEDEVEILCENELLKQIGTRYQSNIVIIPEVFEESFKTEYADIVKVATERITKQFKTVYSELKNLDFHGKSADDNTFKWQILNIAMMFALLKADDKGKAIFGQYPKLSNGSDGFVYGYDNNLVHHKFNGVYGYYENKDNTAWVSVENYRIISDIQRFFPREWEPAMEALTDAVLNKSADENNDELLRLVEEGYIISKNGELSANFAVISETMLNETIKVLLTPVIEITYDCMKKIGLTAGNLLTKYQPQPLKALAKQLGYMKYQTDTMSLILEQMLSDGFLQKPDGSVMPCMYGVINNK